MNRINKFNNSVKKKKIHFFRIAILIAILIGIILILTNRSEINTLFTGEKKQNLGLITAGTQDTSKFRYVKSKDNIDVPVPYGYTASSAENEQYVNALLDGEGNLVLDENGYQKAGGFVIYEGTDPVPEDPDDLWEAQKTRNQYVWVPISSEEVQNMYHLSGNKMFANYYEFTATSYTKETSSSTSTEPTPTPYQGDKENSYLTQYLNGITRESFKAELEERFKNMIESVATYGGFYIGRYETGDLNQNIPKVTRMNENIGSQNWYQMYLKAKKLKGTNENIETNMIWGIQYDETLKWLIDTKSKSYSNMMDAGTWGNYYNVTFKYYDSNGTLNQTKRQSNRTRIPTGATDRNMGNNVYDLAGNVYDWTMETSLQTACRNCRGGYYSNSSNMGNYSNPASRGPYGVTEDRDWYGFRSVLYIK